MKIDFPFWGVLDTADAEYQADSSSYMWIKEHPAGPQLLRWYPNENFCTSNPQDHDAIIPIIYKRKSNE